jgi:hypothetical protein
MKLRIPFLLAALSIMTVISLAQGTKALTPEQQQLLSAGHRSQKDGWTFVHVEGGARARGFQHGYLLAKEIKDAVRQTRKVWEYQSAMEWQWLVEKSMEMFTPKIDREILAEIDGIAEGVRAAGIAMDRNELIALNGSTETMGYWWPTVKDTIAPNAHDRKKESCSSFIATGSMTKNGDLVLAHSTWSSYYYPYSNIIMDIKPDSGSQMLWQTSAGLIHSGTDFFITSYGIVGSETTIGDFIPFDPNGVPEFVRMRLATQYSTSIDEWCAVMKQGNNGGYANAWLIGDTKTNEIARLELGLKYVGFERTKDGVFYGSNIAEDLKILRFETTSKELNIKNANIARRVRWKQLMKEYKGKITVQKGKDFLADHYDTYRKVTVLGARPLCGHWEMDPQEFGLDEPYYPLGAYDGKVVDAAMAKKMTFAARWGAPCGTPFNAKQYLEEHPQYDWTEGLLYDRPAQPWTMFKIDEK